MKKYLLLLFFISFSLLAQDQWNFVGKLTFPKSDSNYVRPFVCTLDKNGNLWVISSKATDTGAHNAIWKLSPGQWEFTKFVDYTAESHRLVGSLRGLTSAGNDLFVTASIPFSLYAPNELVFLTRFKNSIAENRESFANSTVAGDVNNAKYNVKTASGTGTTIIAITATVDTFLYSAIGFQTSIRVYNYNNSVTTPAYGSWVSWADYQNTPSEAGGHDGTGISSIRDIALIPGRNYDDSTKAQFFTSRNSQPDGSMGGIAVWTGGKKLNPKVYQSQRVLDAGGALGLGTFSPTGITVDNQEQLWVTGPDSTKKWVKFFQLAGTFAMEMGELPSKTSPLSPNPLGAPFYTPNDVAVSTDGKTAFVIDMLGRCAYKFAYYDPKKTNVSTNKKLPSEIILAQNFPNPFNPSTMISYELPRSQNIILKVYNSFGQEVKTLINQFVQAGKHSVVFNASELTSGVYCYKLYTDEITISKKMLFVK